MAVIKKKSITNFRTQVRSRHPSHSWLRHNIGLLPFRSVVRLGSTTTTDEIFKKRTLEQRSRVIECNTVEAVKTSSNKLKMKEAFSRDGVKTAKWFTWTNRPIGEDMEFPLVAKNIYGSRGEGNYLLKNKEELDKWLPGKTLSNYIFEKYYNFNREYRIHVTQYGYFYTCRKMLKSNIPVDKRWFRNDSNSTWVLEENLLFDKPINWGEIVTHSIKALKSVGLDVGAIDVKVQSAKTDKGLIRDTCDFIILETNSAPSFGEITQQKYLVEIPKILKYKKLGQ